MKTSLVDEWWQAGAPRINVGSDFDEACAWALLDRTGRRAAFAIAMGAANAQDYERDLYSAAVAYSSSTSR